MIFSGNRRLAESDPEIHSLLRRENERQRDSVMLIASENLTSKAVLEALGSTAQNKYSEGRPKARYYGGNAVIDEIELLAERRAKELFGLGDEWHVNLQGLSGAPANFVIYNGLLEPGERAMGLQLSSGGHLSHGFSLPSKKIHISSKLYDWTHFGLEDDGSLDYDKIEKVG